LSFRAGFAAAVFALAVALMVAGCGDTVVDSTKAGDTAQASLEKSLHEKITSVECPSGQKVEVGKKFTCTVVFPHGRQEIVTLKIRDKDADLNTVGIEPKK
jgi:hypothetical protein